MENIHVLMYSRSCVSVLPGDLFSCVKLNDGS